MFNRFIKNCLITIRHYEDWKDRRHAFDQAFTRRYIGFHLLLDCLVSAFIVMVTITVTCVV